MKKLKQLLEGYAWERRSDGSLPTLQDVTTMHEQSKESLKMQGVDIDDPVRDRVVDLEFRIKRIEKQLGIK